MLKPKETRQRIIRLSAGLGLASLGLFNLALPVLALGTAAGTTISNTATATFDGDGDGTPDETTQSNTVTLTIAEVAGVTNVAQLPVDTNGGSVIPGDTVRFPFDITNTGNDETDIFIPAAITTTNLTNPILLVDTDGDGINDYSINGAGTITPTGTPTVTLTATPGGYLISSVDADATITVTIQGTVQAGLTSGDQVTARLGDTNSNDSSNPNSQNQPDAADTALANEVRTVDNNTADGNTTAPVNGEREAADTSEPLIVGTVANQPLAVATIFKTATSVDDQGDANINNDVISYGLSLNVAVDAPASVADDYTAADLVGTPINIDRGSGAASETVILVSDAIPTDTTLSGTPVAPTGWEIVYTTTALGTAPTAATWTTTQPATPTRVGFIRSGTVAANTTVTGFVISVEATTVALATTPIYNLAQVFGQTEGDANNNIVYDESGDQNPNNFDNNGNPPLEADGVTPDPYGEYTPAEDLGNADEEFTTGGADTGNNNTGNGVDGEPNVVLLNAPPEPPAPGNLLNGPLNTAGATGTVGNNDDTTNAAIAEGVSTGGSINPAAYTFTNSVRNVSGVDLDNIILRPISPTDANTVCTTCDYVVDPLLDGTTVTIAYDLNGDGDTSDTGESAVYTWNAGSFNSPPAVEIPTLLVGQEIDYSVTVDLPNGAAYQGYSIPIVSYVNNDGNDVFNPANELINNITIDTLYTGFLQLTKQAQILYADGTSSVIFGVAPDGTTTATPARQPAPGDRIRYIVTYQNISTASSGTGNIVLSAAQLTVTENGFTSNTWARDTDFNGELDTSNVPGSAVVTTGTVSYFNGNPVVAGSDISGTTAATDVTEYRNAVGTVDPGESGSFSFQRLVN